MLFFLPYCFVNNKYVMGLRWNLFKYFLLFLFYFNIFLFLIFLFIRTFTLLFVLLWSSSWSSRTISFYFPFNLLSFLPSPFTWIGICQIKIAVKLISPRAAGLVIRLMLILVFASQITSKVNIIFFPKLIFFNFTLH